MWAKYIGTLNKSYIRDLQRKMKNDDPRYERDWLRGSILKWLLKCRCLTCKTKSRNLCIVRIFYLFNHDAMKYHSLYHIIP